MSEIVFQQGLFRDPGDPGGRRRLFAETVTNVVVEISSYCNRQCTYCPVSSVDRISDRKSLPAEIYAKILENLAQISYVQSLCLNLYNEPMADRPLLIARIREARAELPKCRIYFSTNGDFLSPDYVREMVEAGLSELYVTVHMPKGRRYDDPYAITLFTDLSKRLGKSIKVDGFSPGATISGRMTLHGLPINVFSINYDVYGTDRAGSVKKLTQATFRRTSPCNRPFHDFTVSHEGTIFPCCQMFVDNEHHRASFAIGRITDFPDIFAAYATQAMARWRAELLRFGPKKSPCDTCNLECRDPQPGESERREELYRRFVRPVPDAPPHPRRPIFGRWLDGGKSE